MRVRVLFLCTGNSARSQIAEGLLRHLGGARFDALSAGTKPRPEVNPLAVEVMRAHGLDIALHRPKDLAGIDRIDVAITVCDNAKESCPVFPWRDVPIYVIAQLLGAFAGVGIANRMFDKPIFFASTHERSGMSQCLSEFVATFGLVTVILGCARKRADQIPFAVGAYITAAYWFTSSTSFANPAVTLARSASNTFAGIRFADVPAFVIVQLAGAMAAMLFFRVLFRDRASSPS